MKRKSLFGVIIAFASMILFFSCGKNPSGDVQKGIPYDPNKPVELTRFYPDSGGMATKLILEGSNFGLNKNDVRVYFNYREEDTGLIRSKRAAVVQSVGDMIYAITPRQPGNGSLLGDSCYISVAVGKGTTWGKDTVAFDNVFMYYTTTTVSTIAGVPDTSDADRTGGTLTTARFSQPRYLTSDLEGNVYLNDQKNDWGANSATFYLINQDADIVQAVGEIKRSNAPSLDPTGNFLWIPFDNNQAECSRFSIKDEFEQVTIKPRKGDDTKFAYLMSLAACPKEGYENFLYLNVSNGDGGSTPYLMKLNLETNTMTMEADITGDKAWGFLAFDPKNPEWLYISQHQLHMISRYNIITRIYEPGWAGTKNEEGHLDGPRSVARFYYPQQICFDSNGHLFIADKHNHCIRKITPDGLVTTVIGQPGIEGYVDGGPDDALFRLPEGVTVTTPDDAVWVADTGNDVLRKLAIE